MVQRRIIATFTHSAIAISIQPEIRAAERTPNSIRESSPTVPYLSTRHSYYILDRRQSRGPRIILRSHTFVWPEYDVLKIIKGKHQKFKRCRGGYNCNWKISILLDLLYCVKYFTILEWNKE